MSIDTIIDDNSNSYKMQNIYKSIKNNRKKLDSMFITIFKELTDIYPKSVTMENTFCINISYDLVRNIDVKFVRELIQKQYDLLDIDSSVSLADYYFRIILVNNNIKIVKKH